MKGKLIILSGVPLSGKSTCAHQVQETLGEACVRVSSDEVRKEITGSYSRFDNEALVWSTVYNRIGMYLEEGKIVIADTTALRVSQRKMFVSAFGKYDTYIIYFWKPKLETVISRNSTRAKLQNIDIPLEVLGRMHASYEQPTHTEVVGYKDYLEVRDIVNSSDVIDAFALRVLADYVEAE
jgi:predicted kinase